MRIRLPHHLYIHLFLVGCGLIGSARQAAASSATVSITIAAPLPALYPSDSGVINVKTQYGAKGDGVTDDTAAIIKAIQDNILSCYPNHNIPQNADNVIYFPTGVYLISKPLRWQIADGTWGNGMIFQGENQATTIIKLVSNTSLVSPYANDPNPPAMIYTSGGNCDGTGNGGMRNNIYNLTIDIGSGNPGVAGVDYLANNQATIRDVTITSDDGQGSVGLDMQREWNGPSLIKNVTIQGFNYGVKIANAPGGEVFEHLHLQNQKVAGLLDDGYVVTIRDLQSNNSVPAVQVTEAVDTAMLTLIDSILSGGSPNVSAIQTNRPTNTRFYGPALFLRNVTTSGYQSALQTVTGVVPGHTIPEYTSLPAKSVFPSPTVSLNLPVEEAPDYNDPNFNDWANVENFGAVPMTSNTSPQLDSTAGIQAAIDSGATTIYFPHGTYLVSSTIHIRGNVHRVIGFGAAISPLNGSLDGLAPIFQVDPTAASPLILERFFFDNNWYAGGGPGVGFPTIQDASPGTLVIKDIQEAGYANTAGAGPLFLENTGLLIDNNNDTKQNSTGYAFNGQKVWARNLDPENGDAADNCAAGQKILNNASTLWILNLKTEGGTCPDIKTIAGGQTELLGGVLAPDNSSNINDKPGPIFINVDSKESLVYTTDPEFDWDTQVLETRNGVTLSLPSQRNFWNFSASSGTAMPLFTGYPLVLSTPSLSSINPNVITAGDPGFSLTLNGADLLSGCTAYWNGFALLTSFVNAAQATASVPASYFVSVGTAAVQTINPDGGVSNALSFSIVPPPQTPDLSGWPSAISLDGTLNLPTQPSSTYQWIFTPETVTSALAIGADGISSGNVASTLTQAPALSLSALTLDPGQYTVQVRVINAAGKASAPAQTTITLVTSPDDLSGVRIYPNPFRSARGDNQITFDEMPAGSTVKIFTVSTRLVKTLSAPAGMVAWDLTNDSGDKVASGVYLTLITDGQGNKSRGKITVIR